MKISLIIFFVAFQLQATTGYTQRTSIPISSSNTSVEETLNQIEKDLIIIHCLVIRILILNVSYM